MRTLNNRLTGVLAFAALAAPLLGQFVYVTGFDNSHEENKPRSVWGYTINYATGGLTPTSGAPIDTGGLTSVSGPATVAVDPTGRFAYVPIFRDLRIHGYSINSLSGDLSSIAGSPFVIRAASPGSIAVDPTGRFAYVASSFSDSVYGYVINSVSGALSPVAGSPFSVGENPHSVAVDPTG